MRKQHVLPLKAAVYGQNAYGLTGRKTTLLLLKHIGLVVSIVFLPVTYSKFLSGNDHVTLCTD